jgi:hypothetical protein
MKMYQNLYGSNDRENCDGDKILADISNFSTGNILIYIRSK